MSDSLLCYEFFRSKPLNVRSVLLNVRSILLNVRSILLNEDFIAYHLLFLRCLAKWLSQHENYCMVNNPSIDLKQNSPLGETKLSLISSALSHSPARL